MAYVRNAWYAIGWSRELGRSLVRRTLMGEPVVLFRRQDGSAAALEDRCPHRFLPLSMGTLVGDAVQCGYHGMTFDGAGRCLRIPGQEHIPASATVRSYPVTEAHGLVWLWPGDPALAAGTRPYHIPHYGDPDWEVVHGEALEVDAHYLALADNLCDPAHVAFVHASTLGNKAHEDVPIEVEVQGDTVVTTRWTMDAEPIPLFKALGRFDGRIDRWQIYNYVAPGAAIIDFGGAPTGQGAREGRRDHAVWMFSCHFLTPITDRRTVDHWLVVKNYKAADPAQNEALKASLRMAFEEDKAVLAAIQAEEERVPNGRPLRLAIDKGAQLMRRVIARRIEAETGAMAAE